MEISFSINLAVLVFVVFMSCVFLLNKWLYIPILNFMDSRDDMIQRNIDMTDANNKEIEDIKKEIDEILNKAKQEAGAIKEKSILDAKAIANKRLLDAKEKHESDFTVFVEKLSNQKNELRNSLLLRLPSFKADLMDKLRNGRI